MAENSILVPSVEPLNLTKAEDKLTHQMLGYITLKMPYLLLLLASDYGFCSFLNSMFFCFF